MKVWVVFLGNYFPREVEAIYSNEAAARAHCQFDKSGLDLNYEAWTVEEKYKTEPPDPMTGKQ